MGCECLFVCTFREVEHLESARINPQDLPERFRLGLTNWSEMQHFRVSVLVVWMVLWCAESAKNGEYYLSGIIIYLAMTPLLSRHRIRSGRLARLAPLDQ